jgi:nucleotide-binding universal stress UspA family protein
MKTPVVVGVDGSVHGLAAVDLAAREAALRDRPLKVVHAFVWPYLEPPLESAGPGPRAAAERIVAEGAARAAKAAPGVHVSRALITGRPAAVLIQESATAAMVVLGDRGLGGFAGLLVGSVAVQVSAHAACPCWWPGLRALRTVRYCSGSTGRRVDGVRRCGGVRLRGGGTARRTAGGGAHLGASSAQGPG